MHTRERLLVIVLMVAALAGCDQEGMMQSMTPPEDEQIAKHYIDLLRQGDLPAIVQDLHSSLAAEDVEQTLGEMAALMPSTEPLAVTVVAVRIVQRPGEYRSNIAMQYQFPDQWLLANVAVVREGDSPKIIGFNVRPLSDSLQNLHRFTLSGRTVIHYVVLALTVAVPLLCLYTLVLCARTRLARRKWLWMLFIAFGFGKVAVNWSSGQLLVTPLAWQLLGAGAVSSPYGPWVLSVSVPIGAIVFLARRKRLALAAD